MGLIVITGDSATPELKVYLTELGRTRLLEQGFIPASFSVSDSDSNYVANLDVDQNSVDLTGDYDDNVYSLSKNVKIKNQIIID